MFKKSIKTVLALSLLAFAFVFTSCSEDEDPVVPPKDIVATAIATPDLSTLVAALKKADLVSALQAQGPFTVFAPKNDAFQALLNSNDDWSSLDDIPTETLKSVLLYHVVSGKVMAADLQDGQEVTTLNGAKLKVDLSNGAALKTVNEQTVKITGTDVEASNGVIHFVEAVLLPTEKEDDIVDLAVATSDLSTLVSALQKADLVSALQADGPFTVFAPKNDAFQALLDSNDSWNSLDDIPVETLAAVLKYHVVSGKVMAADLQDGQEVTTLNGAKLTVDLSDGAALKTVNEQTVKITATDVEASNGVIHFVEAVLLPMKKDIVEKAMATDNLSTLVTAVQKAGLVDALKGDGPMTVFAPTNDAFQALLDSNASWNSLDDIPVETLKNVLLFHVLGSKVMAADLSDTYVNTLATGPNDEKLSLQVETTGGVEFNGDAKPVTTDVEASNGVVHIIDKVMLPPNVVTLALNNAGFTSLVAALTDDRHTTDFVSVLNGNGPFTVFAPTNDAFQALLDSNASWNSISDIPITTLDAVLKYHVVNAANVQSDELTDNQEITMLSGDKVTVDLTSGAKLETTSNQTVSITLTDVQGKNGVIHVIDTVLLQ